MGMQRQNSGAKRQGGYTLVELLIVLALIAAAAALVMPSIGHAFGNLELRLGGSAVVTVFKQAHTHSLYESCGYMVVFGPSSDAQRKLYLVRDDGKTIAHAELPARVRLRAEQNGAWGDETLPVHFFPNGASQALEIDLQGDRDRHMQIVLDPLTGRARVSQIYGGDDASTPGGVQVIGGGSR